MKQYLGVALIVLGTIMLVISYISQTLVDMNWYQYLAMIIILGGVVVHTIILKKEK